MYDTGNAPADSSTGEGELASPSGVVTQPDCGEMEDWTESANGE